MPDIPYKNIDIYERKAFIAITGLLNAHPISDDDNLSINLIGSAIGSAIGSFGGLWSGLIGGAVTPRVYIHPKRKKDRKISGEIKDEVHKEVVDYLQNNNPNSRDFGELKSMLLLIVKKLDSMANSIGAANQRTSREIIETNDLLNKLSELIQKSDDSSEDNKIVKLFKSLPMEVSIALLSDYLKTIITSISI